MAELRSLRIIMLKVPSKTGKLKRFINMLSLLLTRTIILHNNATNSRTTNNLPLTKASKFLHFDDSGWPMSYCKVIPQCISLYQVQYVVHKRHLHPGIFQSHFSW